MTNSVVKSLSQQIQTTVYGSLNKPGNIPVDAKLHRSRLFSVPKFGEIVRFFFFLGRFVKKCKDTGSARFRLGPLSDMNPYLIYSNLIYSELKKMLSRVQTALKGKQQMEGGMESIQKKDCQFTSVIFLIVITLLSRFIEATCHNI